MFSHLYLAACMCVCVWTKWKCFSLVYRSGKVRTLFTRCIPQRRRKKKKRKTAFKCCKGLNSVTSCIRPVCHRVTQNRTVWESNFWLMCVACILPLCTVEFFIKSHYHHRYRMLQVIHDSPRKTISMKLFQLVHLRV